jgi:diaminohydroxyphosphoribosylaminopyrimidine deaminase/5-amino-6-(5-phosphoribosylamino)uracil reductase
MDRTRIDALLDRAVRLAVRGHGGAEPNPMVGCVIARDDGTVIAEGFHRRCGEGHAEVEALRAAGADARGATALVTLEPCSHTGRTGPCTVALRDAGIARVFYAVADPNPSAKGGAAHLRSWGIEALQHPHRGAAELAKPFLKRVTTGLPWVSAKWAQSIDGAIALASGESKWISSSRSRAMVHRERGRVDAILTGIGTVLADDPQLTPRGVRIQRMPVRIVFDPEARTPTTAKVCDRVTKSILLTAPTLDDAGRNRLRALRELGVSSIELGAELELTPALRELARQGIASMLVESGGGLVGRLLRERLLDEAWVFVGPILVGDDDARRSARGLDADSMQTVRQARLLAVRRRGTDALLHYRFDTASTHLISA